MSLDTFRNVVGTFFRGRRTGYAEKLLSDSREGFANDVQLDGVDRPNVVTSIGAGFAAGYHLPVIDLDFPAHLEPSSTPGHFHLYLDRAVTFEQYLRLLETMAVIGLVEWGYHDAVKTRGYGTLRLPGVLKESADLPEYVERLLGGGE